MAKSQPKITLSVSRDIPFNKLVLMRGDLAEHKRLSDEQKKLTFFRPWMKHSFSEKSKIVIFHSQLLIDFITVDEMAWQMLEELDRQPEKSRG